MAVSQASMPSSTSPRWTSIPASFACAFARECSSSEASSKKADCAPVVDSWMIGWPPARSTSSYTAWTSTSAAVVDWITHTSPFCTRVE